MMHSSYDRFNCSGAQEAVGGTLMGSLVMVSAALMLYHTQSSWRLCATTTSAPGTHCTYWQ
jgi:hypothetical protein